MAVEFISHGYDTTTANPYTEVAWAEAHPRIGSALYGVRDSGDWAVSAVTGADRTVSVAPGFGWGAGVTDFTAENETIQLDTIGSGSRWDLIVARRDWTPTAGETKFMAIAGGSTRAIPGGRLSNPGGIDDQPLALVQVTAGQTQPTAIVDLRCWAMNGGVVAKDDLAKSYLAGLGAELYIAGTSWRYVPGANDVPEWVGFDAGATAADVSTFGPGWTGLSSTQKPRLVRQGRMVHLRGGVSQGASAGVANILTVPAAFRPLAAGTTFVGSGVTSAGVAYTLVLTNGVLSVPANYFTGPFPVGSAVPVAASWPLY